jgi:purine-binding chemotaxis protein CheW
MNNILNETKNEANSTGKFLLFELGSEFYAIELLKVKEVITPPETTPIPKSPAHVKGLMNLRGLVLTVIDLRKMLGIESKNDSRDKAVIIFDLGDRLIGGIVDSISKVINFSSKDIKEVPQDNSSSNHIKGIIQHDEHLCLLIDSVKMFSANQVPKAKAA